MDAPRIETEQPPSHIYHEVGFLPSRSFTAITGWYMRGPFIRYLPLGFHNILHYGSIVAFQAMTSIAVIGLYIAYALPIFFRRRSGGRLTTSSSALLQPQCTLCGRWRPRCGPQVLGETRGHGHRSNRLLRLPK
ncbi:hypothetical protein L1987_61270 [Smallanthus sonchifolius]|uniref:Uncharacterized protein n=1 Tax=Smallanthus sonchifolius TaxID=185202 RepID=A0ACB9DAR5_9ASTR|nr:hypothetical protein L1987_61270 [Smallanthus sonchifolius]